MGVGGSETMVVKNLGAGEAAAATDAAAAARVSGSLTVSKNLLAEKTPTRCQAGMRRNPSVQYTAGAEKAG